MAASVNSSGKMLLEQAEGADAAEEDLRLASRINGCEDFPALDSVRDRLAQADRAGYADEDISALMKLLE